MQIRKYVKVFKNRKSAYNCFYRMGDIWERSNLDKAHFPSIEHDFDNKSRTSMRYTVTYYLPKYNKTQKISESDLYGSSVKDARAKFKTVFEQNFKGYHVVVRSVKLKVKRGDNLNLYTFKYYLKPKK